MVSASSSLLTNALAAEQEKISACVHCGLCLEACPTYVATGDENDSPRGRIYLMRAVEEGRLDRNSLAFERHIDRCLGCRACESACPAGVEYGLLLEASRSEVSRTRTQQGFSYWLLRFLLRHVWLNPKRLRAAFAIARLFRDSGLARLVLKSRLAHAISPRFEFALTLLDCSAARLVSESKAASVSIPGAARTGEESVPGADESGPRAATTGEESVPGAVATGLNQPSTGQPNQDTPAPQTVALFTGCVTDGLFKRVNEATARVLVANHRAVEIPSAQVCCGALHAHAGDLEGARKLARQNIEAFAAADGVPVITNAGGCGAMLVSYAHLLADDEKYSESARRFSANVRDVGQELERSPLRTGAPLETGRTTYDTSCHLLHGQHAGDASLKMLRTVAGLDFVTLAGSDVCCGGAGIYNLMEPELSERVLTEKIERIKDSGAELLATGNGGCHMQIAAGARLAGMKLSVCHPVEMLDESYQRAGFYQ
jgi:glycolate oxidase iron-sulfur subunit